VTTRRDQLKFMTFGAALPLAAALGPGTATAGSAEVVAPGARRYDYLGRIPGYRDWAIVPRGLTIRSIETFLNEPYALVRITVNDGSQGWGQIAPYSAGISVDMLHGVLARTIIGQDISMIDAINDSVINAAMKFPWSFVCRALSGIDTALWDLYGQLTQKPVAVLLAGSVRALPAYGSSMRRDISPADEADRLARLRDSLGASAFKIRLGTPAGMNRDAAPGRSEAIIPTVRRAVGDEVRLYADANSCYTPDRAIAMGRRLEDAHYSAFEEPCPYWELEWTREVTEALEIDVQGGEQDNDMAQWRRMIAMRAVDIVQPDICYTGGLTRAWRVAQMADAAGLPVKPHAANVSLVTVFTMHMLAAWPKGGEVEFSIEADSAMTVQARAMFDPVLEMKDGKAVMPEGPGWGIRVKPGWLDTARHRITRQ
jgi:L-alanine-DL-glutamate epimerase-like enolase superfamily enzyme